MENKIKERILIVKLEIRVMEQSNGSIYSEFVGIGKDGTEYRLTGNVYNHSIESNVDVDFGVVATKKQ